jgi:tetratricopeptide (TPR) repeat protein
MNRCSGYLWRSAIFLALIAFFGPLLQAAFSAQPAAQLVLMSKPTDLVPGTKDQKLYESESFQAGYLPLVMLDQKTITNDHNGAERLAFVQSLGPAGAVNGWVNLRNVTTLDEAGNSSHSKVPLRSNTSNGNVPAAIRLQPPAIVRAWFEVQAAIAENERLSAPLAEPYFARAEILTLAKDFDSALIDYLRALNIASHSRENVVAYAAYFERLRQALENYDKEPRPPVYGSAASHYSAGVHSYRTGDFQSAKQHFTNAIALESATPLYWYYRALTYKCLGDERRAKHDALIGAHLESRHGERDKVIGASLTTVQGDLRLWLETFRTGDPARQLLP